MGLFDSNSSVDTNAAEQGAQAEGDFGTILNLSNISKIDDGSSLSFTTTDHGAINLAEVLGGQAFNLGNQSLAAILEATVGDRGTNATILEAFNGENGVGVLANNSIAGVIEAFMGDNGANNLIRDTYGVTLGALEADRERTAGLIVDALEYGAGASQSAMDAMGVAYDRGLDFGAGAMSLAISEARDARGQLFDVAAYALQDATDSRELAAEFGAGAIQETGRAYDKALAEVQRANSSEAKQITEKMYYAAAALVALLAWRATA